LVALQFISRIAFHALLATGVESLAIWIFLDTLPKTIEIISVGTFFA